MKAKLLLAITICLLATSHYLSNSSSINVYAKETTSPINVIVEVNETNVLDHIKRAVISKLVLQDGNIDVKYIDFEKSKIEISQIDTTTVGFQRANVLISLEINHDVNLPAVILETISASVDINIVDTHEPQLKLTTNHLVVGQNTTLNYQKYISEVTDNSYEDLTDQVIICSDEVDLTSPGNYQVTYMVKDSSNNIAEESLAITVTSVKYYYQSTVSSQDIQAMLDLMNEARNERGIASLTLAHDNAEAATIIRASEAAAYLSHTRPNGTNYKTAFSENSVSYSKSPIEILVRSGSTVNSNFDWWMSSTDHRNAILNPNYTHIAIAAVNGTWVGEIFSY